MKTGDKREKEDKTRQDFGGWKTVLFWTEYREKKTIATFVEGRERGEEKEDMEEDERQSYFGQKTERRRQDQELDLWRREKIEDRDKRERRRKTRQNLR